MVLQLPTRDHELVSLERLCQLKREVSCSSCPWGPPSWCLHTSQGTQGSVHCELGGQAIWFSFGSLATSYKKNKLPFSSYLPSSVYVNFASCYCSNSRDGEMLLISFFWKVFFSKQLVLNRTKQPRNSMLIPQTSSNVRALYIVSALAEMKLDYVNLSQPFNLFNSDTFTTGFPDLERLTLLAIARVGKECL